MARHLKLRRATSRRPSTPGIGGEWFDFAIMYGNVLLGRIGLDELRSDGIANIGYRVRTSQTRRGYATRAVRLVWQLGCEDLRLERLELRMPHDHRASRRVADKAGATFEGMHGAGSCIYACPPDHVNRP